MDARIQQILHNLKESFNGTPWYGMAVLTKLEAVDWQQVNEKKYGEKSIAILVQHMINWRVFVLKKLQGDALYDLIVDSDGDWTLLTIHNEQEWKELLKSLKQTQEELVQTLSGRTDKILEQTVPGKNYRFGPILTSIAQHDIYHLGQIAMLSSSKAL
ncbi:MAG: DinB family protein [Flavobacteriaceae bacterium]